MNQQNESARKPYKKPKDRVKYKRFLARIEEKKIHQKVIMDTDDREQGEIL